MVSSWPEYLLALGAQYPNEQRSHPIVSLHDLSNGDFLQLSTTYMGREVGIMMNDDLTSYTRFACRKR